MVRESAQFDESLVGSPIYDQSGDQLGKVKEVRGRYFKVDARMQPDYWLTTACVGSASGGRVTLTVDKDRLDEYKTAGPEETAAETRAVEYDDSEAAGRASRDAGASAPSPARAAGAGEGAEAVQLREEQLQPRKEAVQAGEVGIRKEVVTEQQTVEVPVTREEAVIERHPVDRQPSDRPVGEGEEVRVPLRKEEVTVEKQPVVTEEVALGKRQVQDTEQVAGEVRREEARIERAGEAEVRGTGAETPPPGQQRPGETRPQ